MITSKSFTIKLDKDTRIYWVYNSMDLAIASFKTLADAEYFIACKGKTKKIYYYKGYTIERNVITDDPEESKPYYTYCVYGIDKSLPIGVCLTERETKEFINKRISDYKEGRL